MLEEYGMVKNTLQLLNRAPKATREIWDKLGISPRGIDREVVDCMHRIQMGVGADYVNILLQGLRCSLSDGWGGSMLGTDISDVLFGTPTIKESKVNLAVLKEDHVNIAVHGHNPVLSEMVVKAVADPELVGACKEERCKRHQPRRALLHGKRAADAQRRPDDRQPLQPGARHHDRGT